MQIIYHKRMRLLFKKRVQLPRDWFGAPTWRTWRQVKRFYNLKWFNEITYYLIKTDLDQDLSLSKPRNASRNF